MKRNTSRFALAAVLLTLLLAVAVSPSWAQGPTGVDPSTENLQGNVQPQTGQIGASTFYGIDLRTATKPFFTATTAAIEPVTVIVNAGVNYYGGDFANNDFTKLYVLSDVNAFGTLNTTTGAFTSIGTATPGTGQSWTGMTWDASTSTMYATSAVAGTANLYTVNLTTGASTLVAPITGNGATGIVIEIAASPAGQLYLVDIGDDSLYSLNKATGVATLIGATGIAANFAQGMDFDDSTGTLYWASYSGAGANSLVSLNLTTGASTAIGSFTNREVDAFAFAESAGGGATPTATATGQATATATASPTPGTGNTYCSTETVTIPDNLPAGANSVLNVSDTTTISDLNVSLDVTHSWIGDVAISLNHGATTAELFDRPGYSGTGFGCSGDDLDNTADDEAATAFETSCANTVPAYPAGNSYIPGDPSGPNLAAFDGQSVAGAWTLNISDNAAGDTGTLNGWCLIVGGGGPDHPTATATPGADPDITVNPSSVTETHNTPPQTTNQNLTIGNVGGATLTWTITEDNGVIATANQKPYVPGTVGNAPAAQGNNSLSAGTQGSTVYTHDLVPSVGSTTVTHSSTQDIETGNSVSCNAGGLHTDNSYYRVFDLAGDFGITDTFTVNEISFAVEQATGATGTQPVSVILYTLTGPFTLANLTEIGREDISLADTAGTIETTAFSPAVVVPVNAILVVEIFTPSGQATGNSFFIGSNTAAQTDPSYLRAADCGITQPTDTAAIGFPDMHIVINATGDVGGGGGTCSAPSDIPWLTLSPTNGSTAPGGSSNVTLTFNSATLSQGTYTGTLCIDSNDPDEALVQVPVTLNVGAPTAIDLGSLTQSAGGIRIADFAAAGILLLAGGVLLFRRRK